jgi:hypothetical protein
MENMERRRFDSVESWSMILDSENVETWEVSKEDREEWTADLSQLFIGNKFASGAHSRIYRGIYKQRAVAVKMVRIPNQKEETRTLLEQQFKSEVALLSRLFHPNIVQVCFHAKVEKKKKTIQYYDHYLFIYFSNEIAYGILLCSIKT